MTYEIAIAKHQMRCLCGETISAGDAYGLDGGGPVCEGCMEVFSDTPGYEEVHAGLEPGVYSAELLNPPSGDDCTHLLVRRDSSLGWCYASGEQSEDEHGRVSRFSASELCDDPEED
jgi:hypothetical protein